ncbi:MAG TPA: ABC-2 transporter permease [Clostridium sp.]
MNAINYLKFDLRIIKESIKYYVLLPTIFCVIFMFFGNSYPLGISYLFFFLVISATIPFSMQANGKSTEMYYMFPAKISSMVFGRFLYLVCSTLVIYIFDGLIMTYLYKTNKLNDLQILLNCLCGLTSVVACCIQYPIYYKFGLEKGGILSIITYLAPAFIVFMLPDLLKENTVIKNINNSSTLNLIFLIVSLLITIFIGYMSYLISCKICKTKEI